MLVLGDVKLMDEGGAILLVAITALGMWAYQRHQEPLEVRNYLDQREGAVALTKFMSGQVGVFHGFLDDGAVCETVRARLEADGGLYGCVPVDEVAENP